MDQHEWSEWQDDASSLDGHDPSLDDSGTASLGDHDPSSLPDHDAGFEPDTVDLGDGFDPPAHTAGHHEAPLPDDSFESEPDGEEAHATHADGSADAHDSSVVDGSSSEGLGTAPDAQHPADAP